MRIEFVCLNLDALDPRYRFYTMAPYLLKKCITSNTNLGYSDVGINQFSESIEPDKIVKKIISCKPDVVAFSIFIWNYQRIYKVITGIKQYNPDIIILIGGPQSSTISSSIDADIIVLGEAEETVCKLINNNFQELPETYGIAYKKNGKWLQSKSRNPPDLAKLPSYISDNIIFKEAIPRYEFAITYETSRGCNLSCNYCQWGRTKIRTFPLDKVFNELNKLLQLRNLRRIYIADANFFYFKDRAIKILQYLSKHNKLNIPVHFEINPAFLDKVLLKHMKRFREGIYDFGIQTLNKDSAKLLNRSVIHKTLQRNLKLLKGLGTRLDIRFNIIYGLPGDNIKGFVKTTDQLIALKPRRITTSRLLLLPGSEFQMNPKKYGIYSKDGYIVDYTTTYTPEQMRRTAKLVYYMNIFFGNKLLKWTIYTISNLDAAINRRNPRYVENIVRYFDFIDKKTNMRMRYSYEELEESSPDGKKLKNFDHTIYNIRKKKPLIIARSVEYCLKQVMRL